MQPCHVAKLLKDYEIKPDTFRLDANTTARGYKREQFNDAWGRYHPDLSVTTQQTKDSGAFSDSGDVTDPPDVTGGKMLKPAPDNDCYIVTDRTGGNGGSDEYPPSTKTRMVF